MAMGEDIEAVDLYKRDKDPTDGSDNDILLLSDHGMYLRKIMRTAIPAVKMTAVSKRVSYPR
jgi:hypothetical protein